VLGNYAVFAELTLHDRALAERLYEQAVAAAPRHANNLRNYADFLAGRGAPDRAAALYEQAVAADPTDAAVLGNYAVFAELTLHDPALAERLFTRPSRPRHGTRAFSATTPCSQGRHYTTPIWLNGFSSKQWRLTRITRRC